MLREAQPMGAARMYRLPVPDHPLSVHQALGAVSAPPAHDRLHGLLVSMQFEGSSKYFRDQKL